MEANPKSTCYPIYKNQIKFKEEKKDEVTHEMLESRFVANQEHHSYLDMDL